MVIVAIVIGLALGIGLFIVGFSKKKIFLSVFGAIIGMVLLGLLAMLALANSPLWSM